MPDVQLQAANFHMLQDQNIETVSKVMWENLFYVCQGDKIEKALMMSIAGSQQN